MKFLSIAAATAVIGLAAPAAAQAATYTVGAGGGDCAAADTTCETVAKAAAAAAAGDAIQIAPGTYDESVTFPNPNVTVTGSTSATGVVITGSLTFAGNGTAASVLEKVVVAPGVASSTAVGVTGTAGVSVRDALLISTGEAGMSIANGTANSVLRSTVVSGGADKAAIAVQNGDAPTNLTLESSILSGGPSGAGLTVKTGVNLVGTGGNVAVTARHITIAGSANGIVLDSSAAEGVLTPVGSIAVTVSDSIVLGANPAPKNYTGLLLIPPNTATLALTRTDQGTATPEAFFANPAKRNFRLRADSPAIDKAQTTAGESETDVDGQPRTNGAASDLGADEFVNTAPKAVLAVKSPARSGEPVPFDASGSTDREAGIGGEIVKYLWSFGDGQTAETTVAQTTHTYGGEGPVVVTLTVVDKQGASSEPVTAPLQIVDGAQPAVAITTPKNNAKIKISKTTTKTVTKNGKKTKVRTTKLTPITIAGTATDKSGVKAVVIIVEKLGTGASATQCTWLDPSKGLIKRSCKKPVLIRPRVSAGRWSYNPLKKLKKGLSAGVYRVSAIGTDNTGVTGNSAPQNKVIKFTLTKK